MKEVKTLALSELIIMANKSDMEMVKADVDVEQRIMVIDASLHSDIERYMLDNGSEQHNLWGINLYPNSFNTDKFIEFDSMINIRPSQGNRSRYVEDSSIRAKITDIVMEIVYVD